MTSRTLELPRTLSGATPAAASAGLAVRLAATAIDLVVVGTVVVIGALAAHMVIAVLPAQVADVESWGIVALGGHRADGVLRLFLGNRGRDPREEADGAQGDPAGHSRTDRRRAGPCSGSSGLPRGTSCSSTSSSRSSTGTAGPCTISSPIPSWSRCDDAPTYTDFGRVRARPGRPSRRRARRHLHSHQHERRRRRLAAPGHPRLQRGRRRGHDRLQHPGHRTLPDPAGHHPAAAGRRDDSRRHDAARLCGHSSDRDLELHRRGAPDDGNGREHDPWRLRQRLLLRHPDRVE